jgi:hypothetical protein
MRFGYDMKFFMTGHNKPVKKGAVATKARTTEAPPIGID